MAVSSAGSGMLAEEDSDDQPHAESTLMMPKRISAHTDLRVIR
jgi:hypothetical protein